MNKDEEDVNLSAAAAASAGIVYAARQLRPCLFDGID